MWKEKYTATYRAGRARGYATAARLRVSGRNEARGSKVGRVRVFPREESERESERRRGERLMGTCTIAELGIQVSTTRSYFLNKHAGATGRSASLPSATGVYFEDSYKCGHELPVRVKVGIALV